MHIHNQEIFDNLGNSGKASTIPAEFVYRSIAGIAENFWNLANTHPSMMFGHVCVQRPLP